MCRDRDPNRGGKGVPRDNKSRVAVPSEANTCRKFVVRLLQAAGLDTEPHSIFEQRAITDGRIVPVGKGDR